MPDVVTIGETMVSFVPKNPTKLRYADSFTMRIAGAESNTAIGLERLGCSTRWISRIGNDEFGQYIVQSIRAEGVDTSGVIIDAQYPTAVMFKQISAHKTDVFYYRNDSAASHLQKEDIPEKYLADSKLLHITGITPILSNSCHECILHTIELAKKNGLLVSFDPNIRLKLWKGEDKKSVILDIMKRSDILLLGLSEAHFLLNIERHDEILDSLFTKYSPLFIALKDGANGAYVSTSSERHFIKPKKCVPVDPVGAGDGFNSGFLYGILRGLPLLQSGEAGALMGAHATETNGDTEGYLFLKDLQLLMENQK